MKKWRSSARLAPFRGIIPEIVPEIVILDTLQQGPGIQAQISTSKPWPPKSDEYFQWFTFKSLSGLPNFFDKHERSSSANLDIAGHHDTRRPLADQGCWGNNIWNQENLGHGSSLQHFKNDTYDKCLQNQTHHFTSPTCRQHTAYYWLAHKLQDKYQ